jgi:peptidoglycan DL-endopeptidase CwlO
VTYAYRSVGITHLPRSSSAMYSATTRISRADLRPGDLVFYYSPVSHVAIYIGNGQVVEAPNSGATCVRPGPPQGQITGYGRV